MYIQVMSDNIVPPISTTNTSSPMSGSPSESSDIVPDAGQVSPSVSPVLSDSTESPIKKTELGDGEGPIPSYDATTSPVQVCECVAVYFGF